MTRVSDLNSKNDITIFKDEFDKRSGIICIYHHEKLVASARMVFCDLNEKMELELYYYTI